MTARSAHVVALEPKAAIQKLVEQLGPGPHGVVFCFGSTRYDMGFIAGELQSRLGGVPTIGCSTCGEFVDKRAGTLGIAALALPQSAVKRCVTALAEYDEGDDIEIGMQLAVAELEAGLGQPLRTLDTSRHVGIVLIEGSFGSEERVNAALGRAAPFLSFVGGSAGDDLRGMMTTCVSGRRTTHRGCALAVLELTVPYTVLKTCHFVPTDRLLTVTRAEGRNIQAFDGEPAVEAYAAALGISPDELQTPALTLNPLGILIEGKPWIRTPLRVAADRSIVFACEIPEGTELHVMRSTGRLVEEVAEALVEVENKQGCPIRAAVLFNCVARRLEMDALGLHQPFVDLLTFPAAGFHTYGESWLGHMNQTLTGIVFG